MLGCDRPLAFAKVFFHAARRTRCCSRSGKVKNKNPDDANAGRVLVFPGIAITYRVVANAAVTYNFNSVYNVNINENFHITEHFTRNHIPRYTWGTGSFYKEQLITEIASAF